jgi:hypothetical protein
VKRTSAPRRVPSFLSCGVSPQRFHGDQRDGAARHHRKTALDQGRPEHQDQKSELLGRGLVVLAAEQYASRLVVPQSQRSHPIRWSSHKDLAAKALKKLVGPHLPATLKQLENAIKRAHKELADAENSARAATVASTAQGSGGVHDVDGEEIVPEVVDEYAGDIAPDDEEGAA